MTTASAAFRLQLLQRPQHGQPRAFEIDLVRHDAPASLRRASCRPRRAPRSRSSARSATCASTDTESGSTSTKPTATIRKCFSAALAVPHRAGPQRREERRVAGQHAEVAFDAGQRHLVDLLGDRRVGRDDVQRELGRQRHGRLLLQLSWRFSIASSIVPTR